MDFNYLYTSLDGRINRAKWWAAGIILAVALIVLQWIVFAIFGFNLFGRLVNFVIGVAALYPFYALAAKRFQDRNKPAMYGLVAPAIGLLYLLLSLFGLVGNVLERGALDWIFSVAFLAVGIWYLIDLGILKGTDGPNQYGPDPLAAAQKSAGTG